MKSAVQLAETIAGMLDERHGEEIVTVNLVGHSTLADYFVIATAGSTIHARAMGEAVVADLKSQGERVNHVEGLDHATWVLLDYVDVIVHIFTGELRQFYGLERLWGDLPSTRRHPGDSPPDHGD